MKKLILPFFLLFSIISNGQSFKKYIFLEHITNSRCGICGSKNPGFYGVINNYPKDIVHISYHPSFPYSSCEFYKANPNENNGRVGYYPNVAGTPSLVMNGTLLPSSSTLITDNQINAEKALKSPIEIKVVESGTTTRSFQVTINKDNGATLAAGNFIFYAYMAEKLVPIATPNGEKEHHDVFRKSVTPISGTDITSQLKNSNSFTVPLSDYVVPSAYNEKEMYLIAFIQNATTKEILNVGTKFTTTTGNDNITNTSEWLTISPNPLISDFVIQLKNGISLDEITITNINGNIIERRINIQQNELKVDLSQYPSGNYLIIAKKGDKVATQQIVKQ